MSESSNAPAPQIAGDPIANRFFLSPEQKRDKKEAKRIIQAFYTQQTLNATDLNFFKGRNAHLIELLQWAKGSQDISEFLGYMNISDANKAYLKIDTTQNRSLPQFIETLVESMAKTKLYPSVKAIDDGSMEEKEERLFDALFRMHEVQTIAALQERSGVQVEPTNVFVPNNEVSARVWMELQDRLPKEIRFEEFIQFVLNEVAFESILNRKTLRDIVVTNIGCTKIDKIAPGKYLPRKCTPTNMIYNYFQNDRGEMEVNMIGEFTSIKVKDFRKMLGKSATNPDGLSEKEIFDLAVKSNAMAQTPFTYDWNYQWANQNMFGSSWPYDDANIQVLDCEINFGEDLYYVEKTDDYGKVRVEKKNGVPYQTTKKDGTIINQPKPDNVQIKKRQKNSWMRGLYAYWSNEVLYWGEPDIIISEYTRVFEPLSSFTIVIPGNDGTYVPSLMERSMSKIRDYQLSELKRRQIIALVEPDGWTIDVENVRNLDLGDGNSISWEQVLRIKNQTGMQLYSSKGIDPSVQLAPPISPGVQSNNLQKIMEFTNVMTGIANEIRQLLGIPFYRDGADVGERTAAALAEGQNTNSYNVTDYTANGNKELWTRTCYKLCLLKWNDIVKTEPETKDDLLNTRFDVKVEFRSTEYERQRLEQDIQSFSQIPDANGNPSISPKDAMMLRQIGAENIKLANWYLETTFDENRARALQEKQQLAQETFQAQAATAQQTAQRDLALQTQKIAAEKDMKMFEAEQQMKVEIVKGSFAIAAKSETAEMPAWIQSILPQLGINIQIPLQQENQQLMQGVAQQQQAPQPMAQ